MNARYALPVSAILLVACGQEPAGRATDETSASDSGEVVSAIVPPDETSAAALPPSYEVAIASAAADRNQAIENCEAQPESMRARCVQEANVAFTEAEAGIQDLRGNQQ